MDPWSLSYRMDTKKLVDRRQIPDLAEFDPLHFVPDEGGDKMGDSSGYRKVSGDITRRNKNVLQDNTLEEGTES